MKIATLISEIIISLLTTSLGSFLSYKTAIKESNNKIEEIRLNSKKEINAIKEHSNSEIARIQTECMAKIKEKEEDTKNELILKLMNDPKKLQDLLNVCNNKKNSKFFS